MQRLLADYGRFSFAYFCYFVFVAGWIAFWPLWLKDRGFSSEAIGLLASMVLVTKIVAPSVWGYIADRQSKYLLCLRICGLAGLIFFCGIFYRQDFYWLMFIVFAFSFFWNAVMPQLEVLTLGVLSEKNEQARYTQVRLWGSIGFVVAVVFFGWVFEWLPISSLPALLFICLLFILLSSALLPTVVISRPVVSPDLWRTVKQPVVVCFFLVCFFLQLSHGPYYTFFSVYLEDLGYARKTIGLLWSLGVVAEIVLYIYMRKIFQRFSLHIVLVFSVLLTVVRWLCLAYFADEMAVLVFSQLLHAFSFGAYHAVGFALIRRFFAGGNEGAGMGLYSGVSFGVGGTLGAFLSGKLWDHSAELSFVLAALMAFIACVIAWFGVRGEAVSTREV